MNSDVQERRRHVVLHGRHGELLHPKQRLPPSRPQAGEGEEAGELLEGLMTPPMDSSILNRDSLLLALKQEKEKRPENYWRV